MTYTAKAFVHIKDKDKRIEVYNKLKELGYPIYDYDGTEYDPATEVTSHNELFEINEGVAALNHEAEDTILSSHGFIDCGNITIAIEKDNYKDSAIALFLELAQMRDDVEYLQLFINTINKPSQDWRDGEDYLHTCSVVKGKVWRFKHKNGIMEYFDCERATPQQVADNWDKIKNLNK